MSAREVLKILESNGFVRVWQRGSHIVMQRKFSATTVTAIVPDYQELRLGTLSSIIRQSQLPRELFEV